MISFIAIVFSVFELWANSFAKIPGIERNAIFLLFVMVLSFLSYPFLKRGKKGRIDLVTSIILAVLGVAVCLYVVFFQSDLHLNRGSIPKQYEYILAAIAVILVLEATRRSIGLIIPVIGVLFILYAVLGRYLPGNLAHRGIPLTRVLYRMYFTYEGLFGTPITVASTYIFLFILFGSFLNACGVGKFFSELAMSMAGKRRGGPAHVAVISSGIMGTINGSAAANVATTGTITIPLMKEIGFTPHMAGAIEAAASTGGMIMPPIMGAAAFLMASFLEVPYITIIKAAIVPAILYYLAIFFVVIWESNKLQLAIPDKKQQEEIIPLGRLLLTKGQLLLPIVVITALLVLGFTPLFSGFLGIVTTILVSFFRKDTRLTLKSLMEALDSAGRSIIQIGTACAAAGIIVGIANLTGVGASIALNIIKLSGGNLFLALVFIMAVTLIMSMGLPATALYIIVAVISAPALVQMGVTPLAAHFFVFWFGVMSNITPPVCLASYTAAGIARSDPNKTAWYGLKLASTGFIIPFIFAYNPILLMEAMNPFRLVLAIITATIGVFSLSISIANFYKRKLMVWERILFFANALLLIRPGIITDTIGLVLLVVLLILNVKIKGPQKSKA